MLTSMKYLLILAALLPSASLSQEMYGDVLYLNGWQLPDGSYQTAIEFDLHEGWKTYWRTPGPAGIPPSFDWSKSRNIANIEINWPTPEVFETFGMSSIGYHGAVTLPVRITPIDKNTPVSVDLSMNFGVCSDICVPAHSRLSSSLGNSPDYGVNTIKTALAKSAISAQVGGVKSVSCTLTPNGKGFDIQADIRFSNALSQRTTVIEYDNPDIWIDIAKTNVSGQNLTAKATMEYYGNSMLSIDRSNIRITVLEGGRAVEINGCPAS